MGQQSGDASLNRRDFLVGASALIGAMHADAVIGAASALSRRTQDDAAAPVPDEPLIVSLRLLTAVPLVTMVKYYRDLLGFPVTAQSDEEFTVQAGATLITFVKVEAVQGAEPFYHFAFNIPHNKLMSARAWQLKRTPLVIWPERKNDPRYPNDVRHFKSWNAHSLFFWDPANNVLEYIARHDLHNDAPDPEHFSTNDILYASEIAFVVDDQNAEAHKLNTNLGLPVYPKGGQFWWAMGDERGLLLCIPKRKWGTDPEKQVTFAVSPTEATIRGPRTMQHKVAGFPYTVSVQGPNSST